MLFCRLFVRYQCKGRLFCKGDPTASRVEFQLVAHSQLKIGETGVRRLGWLGNVARKSWDILSRFPTPPFRIFSKLRASPLLLHMGQYCPSNSPTGTTICGLSFPSFGHVSLGLPAGKYSGCPTYMKHLESFTFPTCAVCKQTRHTAW